VSRHRRSQTYNARRLGRLDRETVRLDGCARAFFVAFAVFALDLPCVTHQPLFSPSPSTSPSSFPPLLPLLLAELEGKVVEGGAYLLAHSTTRFKTEGKGRGMKTHLSFLRDGHLESSSSSLVCLVGCVGWVVLVEEGLQLKEAEILQECQAVRFSGLGSAGAWGSPLPFV